MVMSETIGGNDASRHKAPVPRDKHVVVTVSVGSEQPSPRPLPRALLAAGHDEQAGIACINGCPPARRVT